MKRTIRVTGTGSLSQRPDMMRLTLRLSEVIVDYQKALEASSNKTSILRKLIIDEGFEGSDLKTSNFSIDVRNESYTDKEGNWKTKFVGYEYTHILNLEFSFDNSKLGSILGALAASSEIEPVLSISYFVKDTETAKDKLIQNAVENAFHKAKIIAEASSTTLNQIVSIDYSMITLAFETRPINQDMMLERSMAKASYDLNIEPEDIKVSDNVTVVWEIE